MSPTLSLLLGLTVLIPQAFSAVLPVHQAAGINLVSGKNPLDPNYYKVPGTDIAITALLPLGPPLPSLPNAIIACLTAAQSNISYAPNDTLIPRSGWHFTHLSLALAAEPPFPLLGTYGQLSFGLTGLLHLLTTTTTNPGAQAMDWLVEDKSQGTVLTGSIAAGAASGNATATTATTATTASLHRATGTGTAGWRFRELEDSRWVID